MLRHTSLVATRSARIHLTRTSPLISHSHSVIVSPCSILPSTVAASSRSFAIKVSKKDQQKKDAKTKEDAAKKKKKKKVVVTENAATKNADLSLLESLLEKQLNPSEPIETRTAAELALDHEYAKEYSRRCISAHKLHRVAQMNFLKSRWTAINALPVPLRAEALKEDMTPWPKGFQPIPWTPQEYVKRFGPAAEKK